MHHCLLHQMPLYLVIYTPRQKMWDKSCRS